MARRKISRSVFTPRTSSNRSGYIAEAMAENLNENDQQLVRACEAANADPDVLAIEREMDALTVE